MEATRPQLILTNHVPTCSVMLRHVSGLRGAILTFLPLLLLVGSLSAVLLVAVVIDTSAQLWLWIVSWVLFFAGSCVCYGWIYQCRRRTQLEMLGAPPFLAVTTPFLGAWNFPVKRLVGFQAYTSETAQQRKRTFFILLALSLFALCAMFVLFDTIVLLIVIPLILVGYPLLQSNKPAPFQSGIILYFAKTDNLGSLIHASASIHMCADDTTIKYLTGIAEPILEENSKSIAD